PVVLEFHSTPRLAKRPERMDVAIAGAIPIAKLYPHLEGRPGRTHEMRLVDAEPVVEYLDVRQRRLTDADRSDLIGFDERNAVILRPELVPDPGGAHPSGRPATHDDDAQRSY